MAGVVVDDRLDLADDIEVIIDGVPPALGEVLEEAAEKAFTSLPRQRRKDAAVVEDTVRLAIRRAAEAEWGKKPVVKVIVVRV